jgi:general secretion pathway protein C
MSEIPPDPSNGEAPPPSKWARVRERLSGTLEGNWGEVRQRLKAGFSPENLKKLVRDFDPQTATTWATKMVQKRNAQFYGTLTTLVLSTYFASDITAWMISESIPEPTAPRSFGRNRPSRARMIQEYNPIFSRNLFNSQGLIPGEDMPDTGAVSDQGGVPVRTGLPLNLVGTLILTNELRSIATIEDKSNSMVYPVRVDDEIPSLLRVIQIEPKKVIFINTSSGRREFVDLPDNSPEIVRTGPQTTGSPTIEKVAPNQFNVSRSEVDRTLADFNKVLTEARAVPNFENGVAAGYKLFQIVPGSIYDKLGLQNGDVISGVNGSIINDPGKAFEMLNELKTSNHLELQIKKDGKPLNYIYDIR